MTERVQGKQRLVALLAGAMVPLMLLAGLLLPTTLEDTSADWQDTTSLSAKAGALRIPAPALSRPCEFRAGALGLGASVRVYWKLPGSYVLGDAAVLAGSSGVGSVLQPITGFAIDSGNTVLVSGREYRTDVPASLLGGLLGFNTELRVAILLKPAQAAPWTSEPALVRANAGLVAGIGGSCRNLS